MSTDIDTAAVAASVKGIIEKQLDEVPEGGLKPDTSFESLDLDSFSIVEIIFSLEEEFDISISDDDVHEFSTVGNFTEQFIAHLKKVKSA